MIWESCYWKDPLLEMADRLIALGQKDEWSDEDSAQFERDVFIGFYSVRKLFEAPAKVSDECRSMKVKATRFPKREGQPLVDWYNRSEFWELYDLEQERSEERDALFVSHRMIHSFIFFPGALYEKGSGGVFFTSDKDKERGLYWVAVDEITNLFREVGNDYPEIETNRDAQTGEMKIRTFKRGSK